MTITETSDYIIVGEVAPDEQIDANYTDISAAFKETYIESANVLEKSGDFISDSLLFAQDSGFCLALLSSFFVLLGFHFFNIVCSALSPDERR